MGWRDKIAETIVKGIKAYHSSPHDFERFDVSKIGSGQGAQSYGHGLYFAENPKVSGQGGEYWQEFSKKFSGGERDAATTLQRTGFDREQAAALIRTDVEQARRILKEGFGSMPPGDPRVAQALMAKEDALRLLESGAPVGPRTYEVNINADPATMLDWDKPLSSLPEATRESLFNTLHEAPFRRLPKDQVLENALEGIPGHTTGADFYRHLSERQGSHVQPLVSERLQMNDVPGIKYLDEGSRNYNHGTADWIKEQGGTAQALKTAQEKHAAAIAQYGAGSLDARDWASTIHDINNPPTSNYVVFDPNNVEILKKYGVVGAPAATLGGLAAQDQYEGGQ